MGKPPRPFGRDATVLVATAGASCVQTRPLRLAVTAASPGRRVLFDGAIADGAPQSGLGVVGVGEASATFVM
jgi:hypothetical protein